MVFLVSVVVRDIIEGLKSTLLSGFYLVAILLIIKRFGPVYGYRIRKLLVNLSGGVFNPSESTVYTLLRNLEKKNMVTSYWGLVKGGVPRRFYTLTNKGNTVLIRALDLVDDIFKALKNIRGDVL